MADGLKGVEIAMSPWPDISHIKALPPEPDPVVDVAAKCVRCRGDVAGGRCGRCGAIQSRYVRPDGMC